MWAVLAVTGRDAEVLFGFSCRANICPYLRQICSSLEILSRKTLEGVFSVNLVPLMPVMAQRLCLGCCLSPAPRNSHRVCPCVALCKRPEALEKPLPCSIILSSCRHVRFSVGIVHLGGKRTQVHEEAAASLLLNC